MKINYFFCRRGKYAASLFFISLFSFFGPSPLRAQTPCVNDQTVTDFSSGSTTNSYVSETNGGVILKPAAAAEFSVLPPETDWKSFPWLDGGSSTVSGGVLTVDGARFNTEPAEVTYGAGNSVDFVATFAATPFQHIGFGVGNDNPSGEIFNVKPWAMFSTGTNATQLMARTSDGSTDDDYPIPLEVGNFLGTPHHYRIEWAASEFRYYVDESLVHTASIAITNPMRPAISDFNVGGDAISVDWIHVLPFASSGSFESRVFDGVTKIAWGTVSITSDIPAGTSLSAEIRTGSTSIPDGSWTGYIPVSQGDDINVASRFIQYKITLSTEDANVTPVLKGFSIGCTNCTLKAKVGSQTNVLCNGRATGSVTIAATGGTTPYKYKNGVNGTFQDDAVFENLRAKPTAYAFYVVDANGCTKIVRTTITQPQAITIGVEKTPVSCMGGHDGKITVTASGGTGTYQYKKFKTGTYSSNNVFNNLKARTYRIFVMDENGCEKFTDVVISEPLTPCANVINGIAGSDNINSGKLTGDDLNIQISPNPSVTEFILKLNGNNKENVDIKVTDMVGKNVYRTSGSANNLYRFGNEFSPGIYLLQVTQGSKMKTVKIIKQ